MKHLNLSSSVCLFMLVVTCGIANAQTKLGVKAGMNFSNVVMKDGAGNKESTQSKPGIHLGLTVDIPLIGDFYLQPAALYATKGFKQKDNTFGSATNFKANVSYIEVPVNLLFKPKFVAGRLILGAGAYMGYGTGGKWESDTDILIGDIRMGNKGDVVFKNDWKDGEFGTYLYGKPLDYGLNFLVGYELFSHFSLTLNAQLGLANLQPKVNGEKPTGELKNRVTGFSFGYRF